jgi:hypothetical protein
MKRILALALLLGSASLHAQTTISALPSASTLTGTEVAPIDQSGSCSATGGTCKVTLNAIAGFVLSSATPITGLPTGSVVNQSNDWMINYSAGDAQTEKVHPATLMATANAATATALATTPTQCATNKFATGVTANGTANCASLRQMLTFVSTGNFSSTAISCPLSGFGTCGTSTATSIAQHSQVFPYTGALRNLTMTVQADPGAGNNVTISLDSISTTLTGTCTIVGGSGVLTCQDTTHSDAVTLGNPYYVAISYSGSAPTTQYSIAVEFDTP